MTIALVLHPFGENESSGLGRMAHALAQELVENHSEHHFLIITKYPPQKQKLFNGSNWELYAGSGGVLWLERALARTPRADVYLFSTPHLPLWGTPAKTAVIVHDFAYLSDLNQTSRVRRGLLRFFQGRSLRRANRIIAVSDYTKHEVIRWFNIDPKAIEVVHNGVSNPCLVPEAVMEQVAIPYFLYAGGMKKRKNVRTLIEAFAWFLQHAEFPGTLVLTGDDKGSYARDMQARGEELGIGDKLQFVGLVSNAELSYLYRRAFGFLFPSRLEGFGMAALEAMACGLPVIASHSGGLAEAVGDAGLIVDPDNSEDIGAGIKRLWVDSLLRQNLRHRSLERAAHFSWKKAANETLAILKKL